MEYVKKSYNPLLNGGVTPYIRDATPAASAHRSRRRRPQEIHPEYIQMTLAFGSVGEAAPGDTTRYEQLSRPIAAAFGGHRRYIQNTSRYKQWARPRQEILPDMNSWAGPSQPPKAATGDTSRIHWKNWRNSKYVISHLQFLIPSYKKYLIPTSHFWFGYTFGVCILQIRTQEHK